MAYDCSYLPITRHPMPSALCPMPSALISVPYALCFCDPATRNPQRSHSNPGGSIISNKTIKLFLYVPIT